MAGGVIAPRRTWPDGTVFPRATPPPSTDRRPVAAAPVGDRALDDKEPGSRRPFRAIARGRCAPWPWWRDEIRRRVTPGRALAPTVRVFGGSGLPRSMLRSRTRASSEDATVGAC